MIKKFFQEVYKIWVVERPTQLAAALAFASMFSFAPIIFIAYTLVDRFASRVKIDAQFSERLQDLVGTDLAIIIRDSVASISTPANESSLIISIISFIAILFTASGVFFQLQFALNRIWLVPVHEAGQTKSYIRQRLFSFLIVIGMGLMGIMALVVNLILTWFGAFLERLFSISEYNSSILSGLVTLALLTLTCAIFYKILPETPIAWKDVWLGSVTASVLVMIAISLAALFFRYTSPSSALQAAGGFTILMLGFYYIAQIFLLGAIICRVYASMFGSKRLLTTHP